MRLSLFAQIVLCTKCQTLAGILPNAGDDSKLQQQPLLRKLVDLPSEAPTMGSRVTIAPTLDGSPANEDASFAAGADAQSEAMDSARDDNGDDVVTPAPSLASEGGNETDVNTADEEEIFDTRAPTPMTGEDIPIGDVNEDEIPAGGVAENETDSPTEFGSHVESPVTGPDNNNDDGPTNEEAPIQAPFEVDEDDDEETSFPTRERTEYPSIAPVNEEIPTYMSPTYAPPTHSSPTTNFPFSSPTRNPPTAKPYFPNDDEGDPILGPSTAADGGSNSGSGYEWDNSTIEHMEHDKTVVIALSVVFGVMFLFSVVIAHQMLENPHGFCASLCRMTVACFCVLLRIVCYPCRSMCGCTGPHKRDHMIVPDDNGNYTHDLELS